MLNVSVHSSANLLECLRLEGLLPESPCNGKGLCGKCRVRVSNGEVSPLTEQEKKFLTPQEIADGIRLACLTVPLGNVVIDPLNLLQEKNDSVLRSGELPDIIRNPLVSAQLLQPGEPTLENGFTLCQAAVEDTNLPLAVLQKLPDLKTCKKIWAIRYADALIDLRADPGIYGLAVDIGTTTVAVSLVDLTDGRIIGEDGFINPQKAFGLDVLSRIHYDMENSGGVLKLQKAIVDRLQQSAAQLATAAHIPPDAIYEVVVGGNSTMLHALLGVPLKSLGIAPYSSVFTHAVTVPAQDLGFSLNKETRVYCLPSVSTYIGGDIVSGVLASRMDERKDTVLFVDIGTNGEIVLSRGGRMYSCSCAAGPALEGMNISCGMRAEPGAVEHVTMDESQILLKTIGDKDPRGLCGSGLLEAVSQGVAQGIIGKTGRISGSSAFVETDADGKRRIILDGEHRIYLTQNDIRQVQFCKGAILSGILTLMEQLELSQCDIDQVVVAGQFGKHLNPTCLTGAELIPNELTDRISYVGNSSMAGALMCLLSRQERSRAEQIAGQISYIELSVAPGYEKRFTKCLQFGGK